MNCPKCNNYLSETAKFCPKCGEPVVRKAAFDVEGGKEKAKETVEKYSNIVSEKYNIDNKTVKTIIGCVLGAVVILAAFLLLKKPTINLNQYVTISAEGYDSLGRATVKFDYDRFAEKYEKMLLKKVKETQVNSLEEDWMWSLYEMSGYSISEDFVDEVCDGALDRNRNLSNGDTITYVWSCEDEAVLKQFGIVLKHKDIEYKVSGLKQAEKKDPFENVRIQYSGVAPDARAEIVYDSDDIFTDNLYFRLDKTYDINEGDTLTLSVDSYSGFDSFVEEYGVIPTPTEKTITVGELPKYATSLSQLSGDSLTDVKYLIEMEYKNKAENDWETGEDLNSMTYIGSYLLTPKTEGNYWNYHNRLYLVYEISVHNYFANEEGDYDTINTFYWYAKYDDVVVDADGNITDDSSYYSSPGASFTVDSGLSDGWWTKKWYYSGHKSLQEFVKDVIEDQADDYYYEENLNSTATDVELKPVNGNTI